MKGSPKLCFIICPIGEEKSKDRERSDKVLKHIIEPIATECGYTAIRADKISEPGMITHQIITHLLNDDLVIADLTGKNPNVYYELAVRHAVRKAIVQIIHKDEVLPFDVSPTRTISFDYQDLDSVANCKDELKNQIKAVEKDPTKVDSPISSAIDLLKLNQSDNALGKSNLLIINLLLDIKARLEGLDSKSDVARTLTTGQSRIPALPWIPMYAPHWLKYGEVKSSPSETEPSNREAKPPLYMPDPLEKYGQREQNPRESSSETKPK